MRSLKKVMIFKMDGEAWREGEGEERKEKEGRRRKEARWKMGGGEVK